MRARNHGALRAFWIRHSVCAANSGACRPRRPWFADARTFRICVCRSIRLGALRSCIRVAAWARAKEGFADRRPNSFSSGTRTRSDRQSSRRALKTWLPLQAARTRSTAQSEEVLDELEGRVTRNYNRL